MRYTEYHAGKAVIKDKSLLPQAMEKHTADEDCVCDGMRDGRTCLLHRLF